LRHELGYRFWKGVAPFVLACVVGLSACQTLIPLTPTVSQNPKQGESTSTPNAQTQPANQPIRSKTFPRYRIPEGAQSHPQSAQTQSAQTQTPTEEVASLPPETPIPPEMEAEIQAELQSEPFPQPETYTYQPSTVGTGETVRVAILLPLSGPSAAIGQSMLNAAQMALFEVADNSFILQSYDTKGTPEGAAQAASTAVSHGVQLILGPLFSQSVKAVAPIARDAGIGVVAFSTDPGAAGDGAFVIGFLLHQQVLRVVQHARETGMERFAVLAPDTVYGHAVADTMNWAVPNSGGVVTQVEFYKPDGSDENDVVRRLSDFDRRKHALDVQKKALAGKTDPASKKALKSLEKIDTTEGVTFQAVMLPEGGGRLRAVSALLPFYDVDPAKVKLMGTMLWNEPGLGSEPALVGGWFAAPPLAVNEDFETRYAQWFGAKPQRIVSPAYDAVAMAAVLARNPDGPDLSPRALLNPSGFAGVNGLFRLSADGLSERGLAVLEITKKGFQEVAPGVSSFSGDLAGR